MKNSNLIKDRECIECKHFLMCPGKPKGTERCVKFEQHENKFLKDKESK
jgi:hypothetical protein